MAQLAAGAEVAVVSGHQLATDIARQILSDGGNLVDAAIGGAAGLVAALPHACGLGGDCFILVHQNSETFCVNGSGPAPQRLPEDYAHDQLTTGPLSSAVPGMVSGWHLLHQRFGSKPWQHILQPAIDAAGAGIVVCRDFAAATSDCVARLREDTSCSDLFLDQGQPLKEQAKFYPLSVANSLARIAEEGPGALYGGELGKKICRTSQDMGGVLGLDDLSNYEAEWVDPIEIEYRGIRVRTAPPNSYGLALLLQLGFLEQHDFSKIPLRSAARIGHLIAASRHAFERAGSLICDTVSPSQAMAALNDVASGRLNDVDAGVHRELPPSHGTAVISLANASGDAVTIIQSIFVPFGSFVTNADTGIVLNNRLAGFSATKGHPNEARAGKKPAHTLTPAMVFDEGKLRYVTVTPGGVGQTLTLTQILTDLIEYRLDLQDAVVLPRWSMDQSGQCYIESGLEGEVAANPAAYRGETIKVATPQQRFFFGSVEAIELSKDKKLKAVADFRRDARAWAQ
jgi:gamma-glutamyltranspeptidase/glutathione hydrolase